MTEVKYLYIKSFSWLHPLLREEYSGHPMQGRVYKDLYNSQTKNHKMVLIEGAPLLGFDKMKDSSDTFEYEFAEITLDTILDFDIKEEDLDLMVKWMNPSSPPAKAEPGIQNILEALNEQQHNEAEALARGSEILMELYHTNTMKYNVMVEIMEYLVDSEIDQYRDITSWMRYHPTKGLPLNIATALQALDRYNDDTDEDPDDLYEALSAIVIELERRMDEDNV